jgi:hypothetical protein
MRGKRHALISAVAGSSAAQGLSAGKRKYKSKKPGFILDATGFLA